MALVVIAALGARSASGSTSPQAALALIVRARSTRYTPAVASPILNTRAGPLALVAYYSQSALHSETDVYRYRDGAWRRLARVGYRYASAPNPRDPPLHVQLTGAMDFAVSFQTANVDAVGIVSDVGGRWHAVPFNGAPHDALTDKLVFVYGPTANAISPGEIISGSNDCKPFCASGKITYTTWAYDGAAGAFEPVRPISPGRAERSRFQGWGVSLAWWAEIVGGWDATAAGAADAGAVEVALFGNPAAPTGLMWQGQPVDALGLNVVRYNIGASRWSSGAGMGCTQAFRPGGAVPSVEPQRDGPVNLMYDRAQVRVLDAAQQLADGADVPGERTELEAFANSPPWWLLPRSDRCPNKGGDLKPRNVAAYAAYLRKVVEAFAEQKSRAAPNGVVFQTVEPLNEPSNAWPGGRGGRCKSTCQEGAHFDTSMQAVILRATCRQFARFDPRTRVVGPDDFNTSDTLSDWRAYLSGLSCVHQVNTHTYGVAQAQTLGRDVHGSGRRLWVSEYGTGTTGVTLASQIADNLNTLQPQAWVYWTGMEGRGGWGLLQDDSYPQAAAPCSSGTTTGCVAPTPRYFELEQYSRFIRGGAQLFPVSAEGPGGVRVVVARNRDGSVVVVATNPDSRSNGTEPLAVNLRSLLGRSSAQATVYRTDASEAVAKLSPPSAVIARGILTDSLPSESVTTYVLAASP